MGYLSPAIEGKVGEMLLLAIDTSTSVCGVALATGEGLLGEYNLDIRKDHSQRLMPMVDRLLRDCRAVPGDLGGIAVTCGPGSFTGIRIGVATARGLAQGLGIPVVGVPTLDVLAAQFPFQEGLVCPLLDARRQEVYTALYRGGGDGLAQVTGYLALPLEGLLALLGRERAPGESLVLLGDGLEKYGGMLQGALGDRAWRAPPALRSNRGGLLARLGQERLSGEGGRGDYRLLKPLYLRRPEAEVRWEEKVERKR